jgi:uncharacterized protein (UPF0335 family)
MADTPSNSVEMLKGYIKRAANIMRDQKALAEDMAALRKEVTGAGFKHRSVKRAAKIELAENPTMTAEEQRVEIAEDLQAIDLVVPEKSDAA